MASADPYDSGDIPDGFGEVVTSLNQIVHQYHLIDFTTGVDIPEGQRIKYLAKIHGETWDYVLLRRERAAIGFWFRPEEMAQTERPPLQAEITLPEEVLAGNGTARLFGTIDEGKTWLAITVVGMLDALDGLSVILAPMAPRLDVSKDGPGWYPPGVFFKPE